MAPIRLNERQLRLLERINHGRDPVTSSESELAVTVYALQNRRLVLTRRISGRRWTAEMTEVGRFFLARGYHPDDSPLATVRKDAFSPEWRNWRPDSPPITLLRALAAGDDQCRIPQTEAHDLASWRQACTDLEKMWRHLPRFGGFRLEVHDADDGGLLVRLVKPHQPSASSQPRPPAVAVPVRVNRYHPIVAATKAHIGSPQRAGGAWIDTRNVQGVAPLRLTSQTLSRALRVLHALFTEAERRGHQVVAGTARDNLITGIAIGPHSYKVTINELVDRTPHEPTAAERARMARDSWFRPPSHNEQPSGRLRLSLPDILICRQAHWRDGRRGTIEARLAEVLQEIEERAQRDEARRQERLAMEAERERLRREAEEEQRRRQIEDRRAAHVGEVVAAWRLANDIRHLCTDIVKGSESHSQSDDATELERWLSWARNYADSIDPVGKALRLPDA